MTRSDPVIESALPVHAEILAAIHRAAFPPGEAWSRDVMSIQLELPATFGLLARPPEVAGAAGMILARVAADEAEILTLAVMPEVRRSGLGAALLDAAMAWAAALGATTMFLEVATTNQPARMLYASRRFAVAGTRRKYYSDGTDALVLRSTLPR